MGQMTVMVVGLGDLGGRCVDALARLPVERLIAVGRDADRADRVAGQAAIVAGLTGGAAAVEPLAADVSDADAFAEVLAAERPAVVVMAASRHTWWKPAPALPYGAWLPLQVSLVRALARARDLAGSDARIVNLAYPDAVGPVLAAEGLAPDLGAGNVAEMAAKLVRRAPAGAKVSLVAHHATERYAFGAFTALGGDAPGGLAGGPPPVLVHIEGVEDGRALFDVPHPLLEGRDVHAITAAATAGTVDALLGATPCRVHVPSPAGRPGGYPVLASRDGVALDLPPAVGEEHAIAVNATAARWDGIETIAADGCVTFTHECADAVEAALGWRLERVGAGEMDAVADELEIRRDQAASA